MKNSRIIVSVIIITIVGILIFLTIWGFLSIGDLEEANIEYMDIIKNETRVTNIVGEIKRIKRINILRNSNLVGTSSTTATYVISNTSGDIFEIVLIDSKDQNGNSYEFYLDGKKILDNGIYENANQGLLKN